MSEIKYEIPIIKDSIHTFIKNKIGSNSIFSTIEFGFYDDEGYKLPPSIIRKYWDKTEVRKTNTLIKNMLKEAFGINQFFFFIERHSPVLDEFGEVVSEGRFHIHFLTSCINDMAITEPNRRCKRLILYTKAGNAIPYNNINDYKINLFDKCCRQANWINRYNYSIKTSYNKNNSDLRKRVHYCLKNYKPDKQDFMDIIDFDNSSFNKHTTKQLIGEPLCGIAPTKINQESYA